MTTNKLINLALMEQDEREELGRISSLLPDNAVIVEVGTFCGGSAAIMSHFNPLAQLHCFDLFEDDPNKRYKGENQYRSFYDLLEVDHAERTIENVAKVLKDFPNIHLYKKRSPYDIKFDIPIDLYFEDGLHTNPDLGKNLNFWSTKVKKQGYIAMHDCRPWLPLDHYHRYVAVETARDNFLDNGYTLVSHVHGLIILQKNI
jgi:hypothetical protein